MTDLALQLTFDGPETSVAFSRELKTSQGAGQDFRIATLEPKLNMDAATLLLVLKFAGPAASAVAGCITLTLTILKALKKPSVRIEVDGKVVELYAKASDADVKALCDVLLRSHK